MKSNQTGESRSDWASILTGEMLLYSLLGKVLFTFPNKTWLQSLAAEAVFEESPLAPHQPDIRAGLALLNEWSEENKDDLSDAAFSELEADYTSLFIGPGMVLAPPWESVFVREGRMIFQEATLQVRDWYRRYDLQSVKLYKEPDDHIGLELTFLGHLAGLGMAALEQQDSDRFKALLDAQRRFLSEHVLRWAVVWCDQVSGYCKTNFYRGIALVVKGSLFELATIFDLEIPVFVRQ